MRYSDEDLGYVFISESSVSDEHKTVSNIDVRNDDNLFYITFHTNLQSFGDINRNRRRYLGDNVWNAIQKDNRLQCFLRDNCWFGEFEHPAPEYTDKKMTPQRMQLVLPANRAFKILRPKLCGSILEADIQSAQGSVGEGFGKEVLAGWIPSFSLRAIAALKMYQNVPTVFVRKVITYDSVWYPSHEIARATSKPSAHLENIRNFCESAVDNIAASVRVLGFVMFNKLGQSHPLKVVLFHNRFYREGKSSEVFANNGVFVQTFFFCCGNNNFFNHCSVFFNLFFRELFDSLFFVCTEL